MVDLLVELITNSDDSYRHLHEAGDADTDRGRILIEIERHRGDNDSIVSVSDRAGGIADIDAAVGRLGDKTSSTGDRGFMARGLKDCAALGHITIETIRDEEIKKAEITRDFKYIPYTAGRDPRPQKSDRRRLGIPHNGTRVEVLLKPSVSVPLKQTLMRELPWHFALRDIFTGGGVLIRVGGGKPEQLARVEPKAELIIDEEYEVPGYDGIRARFQLFRSPVALEDPPDKRFRCSGILIAGRRAVHECTFFTSELERDPAAEHYFGRLESAGIDQLADEWDQQRECGGDHPSDNPLLLFDPNRRAGLQRNHPFTTAMFSVPIELLKLQFEKDRESARKDQQTVESQETTRRLRRLAREASQFMRDQLEDLDVLGVNDQSFIDKGLVLVPSFTQIHVGAEKRFYVRVDRQLGLPMGTEVSLTLSRAANDALEVVTPPHDLEADPRYEGSQRSAFTMRAKSNTSRVQVSCQVDGLAPVFAEVQVIPSEPQDLEIPDGFAFHRNAYTVRQGGQRTLKLRARFSPRPESPTPVSFRLADERVATLRARSQLKAVPGTTYYEATVTVEGRQLNGTTSIVANAGDSRTEADIKVVSKDDDGVELTFELVPYSLGRNWRALWDRNEPNKLLITTQHESISRYLGSPEDDYPGQHHPPFRVLLAELVADNVCRRIVEERVKVLPHEFDVNRIYLNHSRLMRDFTPLVHKIMLANPDAT